MTSYLLLYGLTSITAIIHLAIGLASLGDSLGLILVLNGLGYIGLIGAHIMVEYWGFNRRVHNYTLLLYTLATFIAYFVTFPLDDALGNTAGLAAKITELAILVYLIIDVRKIETRHIASK